MSDLCSPLMRLAMHDLQLLSGGLQHQHFELVLGMGEVLCKSSCMYAAADMPGAHL